MLWNIWKHCIIKLRKYWSTSVLLNERKKMLKISVWIEGTFWWCHRGIPAWPHWEIPLVTRGEWAWNNKPASSPPFTTDTNLTPTIYLLFLFQYVFDYRLPGIYNYTFCAYINRTTTKTVFFSLKFNCFVGWMKTVVHVYLSHLLKLDLCYSCATSDGGCVL